MSLPLAGLADALRAAGLTTVEHAGWTTRGQTDGPFAPQAVMWHHDASAPGDSPGVPAYMANLTNNGAQTWVDRAGRWHLIAAGRMWHAGTGRSWGRVRANQGNTDSAGVETDHTIGEAWPAVQLDSLRRGTAVLLRLLGASAGDALLGHREYRPTNPDPDGLDMNHERQVVSGLLANPSGGTDVSAADATQALYDTRVEGRNIFDWARQLRAEQGVIRDQLMSQIAGLQAAITTLAAKVGSGDGASAEEIEAAVAKAIRENVVTVDVSVTGQTGGNA